MAGRILALLMLIYLASIDASSNVTVPSFSKSRLSLQTPRKSTRKATAVRPELPERTENLLERQDFHTLQQKSVSKLPTTANPWMLGSFVAVLVVASYLSPALWTELGHTAFQALSVAWIPFLWIQPTTWPSDIWSFSNAMASSWDWFQENAIPAAWTTLKSMIIAEIWRNVWAVTFQQLKEWYNVEKQQGDARFPGWVETSQRFLLGTIQRGTKSMFTKTVQKHVQASISTIFRFGLETIKF